MQKSKLIIKYLKRQVQLKAKILKNLNEIQFRENNFCLALMNRSLRKGLGAEVLAASQQGFLFYKASNLLNLYSWE